ncbi:MAG: site-specific DNA-methyltransferase [Acidobacteriaceae bacterium]
MATGTPRSPRQNGATVPDDFIQVELSYPGKRSLNEILSAPPGTFQAVKSGSANKRLYFAENLSTLAALADDKSVYGNVRLVYIDPPYATQTVFQSRKLTHAYEDVFQTVQYIDFLRERLALLHRILAEDGSIYVHIDDKMLFHVKLVMDEIFGAENYRNCITRKKCNPKNYTRKTFGNVADYILFYTKSDNYIWNRQVEPWTAERAKEYQYVEEGTGRLFMKVPVHAPGIRNGETGKPWRGKMPPPGKHWQFQPATLDEFDAKGEIYWSSNGNPRRKVYFDQSSGIPVQDIWMDFRDAHNQNIPITGYPTEKNLDLLKRIVQASSNPGDIVLDCFAGSGTTLAAADMLSRAWIGIDNSPEALRTMLHRFAHGTELMGDFVGKINRCKASTEPNLFEVISGGTDVRSSLNGALDVQDFTLLTTPDNSVKVMEIATESKSACKL